MFCALSVFILAVIFPDFCWLSPCCWFCNCSLTLIQLTWTIWRAPTNVSKWRMGFNSVAVENEVKMPIEHRSSAVCILKILIALSAVHEFPRLRTQEEVTHCRPLVWRTSRYRRSVYRKFSHAFCSDMLSIAAVNAVHFLILGEMLFILAHAPVLMSFHVLVVYLVVHLR
jgi:hypothetical protein